MINISNPQSQLNCAAHFGDLKKKKMVIWSWWFGWWLHQKIDDWNGRCEWFSLYPHVKNLVFTWQNVHWCVLKEELHLNLKLHMEQTLPYKVIMQYVHCRLVASYFLFPWRNCVEMSRSSILFHSFIKAGSTASCMCKYNFLAWEWFEVKCYV